MSTNPRFPEVRAEIERELARFGLAPPPSIVDALATVAVGYLELQRGGLSALFPATPLERAAASLIAIYRRGVRPALPGGSAEVERFREIVDVALARRQLTWLDHQARSTLAALARGAWEDGDLPGKRQPLGEYFVTLLSNGLE